MLRTIIAAACLFTTSAAAQTTNCQWFGAVWTCNAQQPPAPTGNALDHLRLPDPSAPAKSLEEGFYGGQQMRFERERARAEVERLQAERDYVRSLTDLQGAESRRFPPLDPSRL